VTPLERQRLYAFFSRLWVKEPDEAFREVLRGELGRELLGDVLLDGLDEDFANLTIVNLVPYESFYRREDGMIEAGAANPAAEFLGAYGFEADLAAARSLAPDHLGIELEVMSQLCAKELELLAHENTPAASAARRTQREFLTSHLLTWAPTYLFAAMRSAKTPVYGNGAQATLQFLCGDLESLS
jgi:TorA maturation chaperone TorD